MQEISSELKLNAWGNLQLVRQASSLLANNPVEQTLFAWYILIRWGCNVKCGYNPVSIYLLVETDAKICNIPYVTISGVRYYIPSSGPADEPITGLRSYTASYPGENRPLSLAIREHPALPAKGFRRIPTWGEMEYDLVLDQSLINYLNTYPNCEPGILFQVPLSPQAVKSLDRIMYPLLSGKNRDEQAAILLELVQRGIPYRYDEDQFGEENYLFPDETLFYPYADCEDRAALFARLVHTCTGLPVVGLDYHDPVSAAVCLEKQIPGECLLINGKRFYICDPTYIGAKPGMQMECMRDKTPVIIPVK